MQVCPSFFAFFGSTDIVRDIYRLFERVYLLIILLALIIALPLAVLFSRMMFSNSRGDPQALADASISPLVPCLAGSLNVIVLIAAIVLWNIRGTKRARQSSWSPIRSTMLRMLTASCASTMG